LREQPDLPFEFLAQRFLNQANKSFAVFEKFVAKEICLNENPA